MVDQERMKEYIAMGMSIDDALSLCKEEDAQAKKEAAKDAKAAAAAAAAEPPAQDPPDEGPKFITEDELKKVVNETIETQIKEAKLKDATGNEGGDIPKERTVDDIMAEAVNRMRTGK
jgi:hypothetical protein